MTNGRVIAYGALWTQIETFGAAFRVHGFGATSRVAVMLPAPEAALAIVATACHTGAVPLNPELTGAELDECLASSRIDAMVTSIKIGTTARDLAARHGVHLFEASNTGPGQLRIIAASGGSAKFEVVSPPSDAAALILKTSATTGRSKLVPMTHRNIIATAQRFRFWFDLTENDRPLCALPLYYAHGLKGPLMAPLLLGASVALPVPEPDSDIIGLLADLQPTWIDGGQVSSTFWNVPGCGEVHYATTFASFGPGARRSPVRSVLS
jgi:oxalate---CoA ligase